MRTLALIFVLVLLAAHPRAAAADQIVEFGLVVCQQQAFAAPVVVLSSVQSSEILLPVGSLDLPPQDLPPFEGSPCAEILTDLTRAGYSLRASTPISKHSPPPEEIFLKKKPAVTERLEWTIQLPQSVALLSCEPLSDTVAGFADGANPSAFSVPEGTSCAVHLAAILALGGQIIARNAVLPPGSTPPGGPVTAHTAYELIRTFPVSEEALPRLPRNNNGRDR